MFQISNIKRETIPFPYYSLHKTKFLGVGAFDHLEWTYDGAFEQLFGLGRGEFEQNFPKIARGDVLSFDLTGT